MLTGDKLETAEFICRSVKLKEEHNEFVKMVGLSDPKEMLKLVDFHERNDKNIDEVLFARINPSNPRKCSFSTSSPWRPSSGCPPSSCSS